MPASPEARRAALEARFPEWPRRTLAAHFSAAAETFAERPLLVSPTGSFTYRQVVHEARRCAKALLALGVRRRDHVAVLIANEPEYVFVKLAIAMIGAVAVPLNTLLREDELDYMLRQSDSRWLIMVQTAGGNDHQLAVERIRAVPTRDGLDLQLRDVVCIPNADRPVPSHMTRWDVFLAKAADITDDALDAAIRASEYPDEVSDIIYTSGTTGKPKGVMLTHDMLLRCAYSSALSRAFEDGRRIFTALPMYHVFAYVEGLLAGSFVGGCVITQPSFAPRQALELISTHRAHDVLCVPSMLVALLNHPELSSFDLSSLYALMCAAAPAPVPVWERAVRELGVTEICTGYGGTEATAATVHTEIGDPIEIVATKVGRIKPGGASGLPEFGGANTQYKVVDLDTGEELPPGSVGELVVRGNFVTRGYYKKPLETAAVMDMDGWLRTGDIGRIDEHGYLEFLGRSKEMYKVSGENVSPKEVEDVLTRHPAVGQAYVVGVEDPVTTEIGAAFVELKAGASTSRRELIRWCAERLAKFKVPRYVWFVEPGQWPMTGTGKIQKFVLQQMARERLQNAETAAADE